MKNSLTLEMAFTVEELQLIEQALEVRRCYIETGTPHKRNNDHRLLSEEQRTVISGGSGIAAKIRGVFRAAQNGLEFGFRYATTSTKMPFASLKHFTKRYTIGEDPTTKFGEKKS